MDISEDINKYLVIKTRIDLAIKLIESNEITNAYFIKKVNNLRKFLSDKIFMQRLIMLNNNDGRTSDQLLSKLCEQDLSLATYSKEWNGPSYLFGRRGVAYKEVFQIFDHYNYFKELKITSHDDVKLESEYRPSYVRVILALLYKQKEKQSDRIVFNDADYVELQTLFEEVNGIIPFDDFVEILDRMYSLRDADYWNHLVTFDNIAIYSKENIRKYLRRKQHKDEKKIYLSITTAGKLFLDQVCVHFEYFSQRFCQQERKALFEYDSFENEQDEKAAKTVIDSVFNAVSKCWDALEIYNRRVISKLQLNNYSSVVATSYYYESEFHEERIVYNHVQYLNAYRRYMINKYGNNYSMNRFLVQYIKKYLDLLHTEDLQKKDFRGVFITEHSADIYNRLSICIEKIEAQKYENLDIDITSDCYYKYFNGQKCYLFRERRD